MGVAPRKPSAAAAGTSCRTSALAIARCMNTGIWAIAQLARGRARLQVRHLQAAHASGRQIPHHRRRLGLRRQREGLEPESGGRIRRLGARLAEGRLDRPDRRLVHQGQERHAADASPRSKRGKAAFDSGFLKVFTDEIYPGSPRRAAHASARLQGDLGRHPGLPVERPGSRRRRPRPRPIRSTRSSPATRARRSSDAGSYSRTREGARLGRPRSIAARDFPIARASGSRAIFSSRLTPSVS